MALLLHLRCVRAAAALRPLQKHPQLRRPDSPLQRIGAGLVAGAAPQPAAAAAAAACEHIAPVLSLESVHSPAEANSLFRKLDR